MTLFLNLPCFLITSFLNVIMSYLFLVNKIVAANNPAEPIEVPLHFWKRMAGNVVAGGRIVTLLNFIIS